MNKGIWIDLEHEPEPDEPPIGRYIENGEEYTVYEAINGDRLRYSSTRGVWQWYCAEDWSPVE